MRKKDFDVGEINRFLEPGPVVMITSAYKGERNVMTMSWHTVLEFNPSLVGLMITSADYSHDLIRKSKECVINIPTYDMIDKVIGCGNTTGADTDKFKTFGLTPIKATKVKAPLIKECYANFECKVREYLPRYCLFIVEVVRAHVATAPKFPKTVHYRGHGVFMISGKNESHARKFKPEML